MPDEKRPAVSDRAPSTASTLCPKDTKHWHSRTVSWWSVHEYVTEFIGTLTDWPMAGTPEWCDLDDYDPRKLAAVLNAGSHHSLRIETAQESQAEASKAVAAAVDWRQIAEQIHKLHTWRSTRPWATRQAVNHV